MIAFKEMARAKVRFGLLVGAIGLLVFLILFQQALRDGLITSFVGAIEQQSAPTNSSTNSASPPDATASPPSSRAASGNAWPSAAPS